MTAEAIKAELNALGLNCNSLAKELNRSKTSISFVINRKSVSDRIQRHIAAKLGKEPEEVFPERYQSKETKPNAEEKASENPSVE